MESALFELREKQETKSPQRSQDARQKLVEYMKQKLTPKLTSRFNFDDYVNHLMIDATVLYSESHTIRLLESGERFFISDTLAKAIDSKNYENQMKILSQFSWREPWRKERAPMLGTNLYQLREHCDVFKPDRESLWLASRLIPKMVDAPNLSPEAKQIILEELAFLIGSSALLMRSRATLRLMKRGGIAVIDAVDKFHTQKGHRLKKLEGPRWFLTMLVSFAGLATGNAFLTAITGVGNCILTVVDP